jgi:hypothetical protein
MLDRCRLRYREAMDAARVRRWIAGFEAAAEADREALRGQGADPAWAITLALAMIDSADRAGLGRWAAESQRQADDAAVRAMLAAAARAPAPVSGSGEGRFLDALRAARDGLTQLDVARIRRLVREFSDALEESSRIETFERLLRKAGLGR